MADWFKLHENWFHEPRLQWAIKEQATVIQVWLWALTECCRTKSDTIGLHSEDYELIGIQQLLNLSPGLFNQGLNLLEKIKYIERNFDLKTIKVLKWNDFQSDYLRKKGWRESDNVRKDPEKFDSVVLEERRGDKKREEEPEGFEIPKTLNNPEFIKVWEEWKAFRGKMKACKDWTTLWSKQLQQLESYGIQGAIQSLNASMAGGWQGLFEPKSNGSSKSKPMFKRPSLAEIEAADEARLKAGGQ